MIIALLGVSSLAELFESNNYVEVERPTACPRCKANDPFWRHDSFKRTAIEGELTARIRVQRFLCRVCGLTVSCLFAFLIPYRQFTAAVVATAVEKYGTEKTTYRHEAEELSALDCDDAPRPSHVQVFRWVDCIAKKSAHLLLQMQRELVMQGSAKDLESAPGGSCPNAIKAHSVEKAHILNHSFEVVQLARLLLAKTSLSTLHAHFLSAVESLQAIFSGRTVRLTAPQKMKHVAF